MLLQIMDPDLATKIPLTNRFVSTALKYIPWFEFYMNLWGTKVSWKRELTFFAHLPLPLIEMVFLSPVLRAVVRALQEAGAGVEARLPVPGRVPSQGWQSWLHKENFWEKSITYISRTTAIEWDHFNG